MKSFVVFSLLVMGWGYWALSGGSDFTPERRANTVASQNPTVQAEAAGDAARVEALAAAPQSTTLTPAPVTIAAQTVAAPVFTSLAQRRDNLAAAAAAEAAARAVAPPVLRPAAAGTDLRVVDADRVNLRDGPGTDFVAIGQLTNGTIAEITEYGTGNWVRVQVQGTDQSGWMSARYLISLD